MKRLSKTQKVFASIGITLGILIFLVCGVIDVWYIYLSVYAPDRMTSNTINISQLEDDEGNKAYAWEVKYFSNQNKNGFECLEIKSTYFTDETKKDLYSQGLQYVTDNTNESLDWFTFEEFFDAYSSGINKNMVEAVKKADLTNYTLHKTGAWFWAKEYTAFYYNPVLEESTTRYNYQSYDNYSTTGSTNPLTQESYLTLTTNNDEMLYLQFKGDNYATFGSVNEFKSDSKKIGQYGDANFYNNYTSDYFALQIYNAVQTIPAGTPGTYVLEFGDCFKYYDVDPTTSTGNEIQSIEYDLVEKKIKSYYTMYIEVSADGIKNASESMFGVLHNSPNYSLNGDTTSNEYFTGKTVIDCGVYDFELVKVTDRSVALKLKDSFIEEYKEYSNSITLRIILDNDVFEQNNVEYLGFTADSGLENFEVLEVQLINTEVA